MKPASLGLEPFGMKKRRLLHPAFVLAAITLAGCGTSTPRDPDRPYYGRDRYSFGEYERTAIDPVSDRRLLEGR